MYEGTEGSEPTEAGSEIQNQEVFSPESGTESPEPITTEGESDGEEIEDTNAIKGESGKETARRILKELQAGGQSEGDTSQEKQIRGPDGKFIKKPVEPQKVGEVQHANQQKQPTELKAPGTWNAEEKEAFNKADPKVKAAVARREQELHSLATRKAEEASQAVKDNDHIKQAVRPYLSQNPHILEAGYTEGSFISALVGAHMQLQNPETRVNKWLAIGKEVGIDEETIQELNDILSEGGNFQSQNQNVDISNHPDFIALQNRLQPLESSYRQASQQQIEQKTQSVVQEMQAVIDEVDQNGSYVYPRAHDADFIQKVRPLVAGQIENEPNLPYGEALKRAYMALYGLPQQTNSNAIKPTTDISSYQNNNFNNRANAAAVSVRGKTPTSVNVNGDEEVPAEYLKSAKLTARYFAQKYQR